ncbi:WD repeat-containing protein 60 [Chytridiales sp. JEL 0842]|nr:WD repeat-containing protein 60 [Chytridiales sp. JEL 0842]
MLMSSSSKSKTKKSRDSWLQAEMAKLSTKGKNSRHQSSSLNSIESKPKPQPNHSPSKNVDTSLKRDPSKTAPDNQWPAKKSSAHEELTVSAVTIPIPTADDEDVEHEEKASADNYDDGSNYYEDFEAYDDDFEEFENEPVREDGKRVEKNHPASDAPSAESVDGEDPFKHQSGHEQDRRSEHDHDKRSSYEYERSESRHYRQKSRDYPQSQSTESVLKSSRKDNDIERNFKSALFQQHLRRAKELQSMIELDVAIYDIFDIPPMNEYELYIRNFGSSNAVQEKVSTQWNEDYGESETQTEVYQMDSKWTQAPPDHLLESGSFENPLKKSKNFSATKSEVMDVLLDEKDAQNSGGFSSTIGNSTSITQGSTALSLPSFLAGRHVIYSTFSLNDFRLIMFVWSLPTGKFADSQLGDKSIITLWRLSNTSSPYRVLVCDGEVTRCCTSPNKPYLVLAGTNVGGVVAWDLQDTSTKQLKVSTDDGYCYLRKPCYTTDALFPLGKMHEAGICCLFPLTHSVDSKSKRNTDAGQSVQFASVDESGLVQIWVVLELNEMDKLRAFESDFGMYPDSRFKLLKTMEFRIKTSNRRQQFDTNSVVTCAFVPGEAERFLIGTDMGQIQLESRFRDFCTPHQFKRSALSSSDTTKDEQNRFDVSGASDPAASISFNLYMPELFLCGHLSGQLALYSLHRETPLEKWFISSSVKQVEWSPHKPAVFYVLDEDSNIHVWDLLVSRDEPIQSASLGESGVVSCFSLSPTVASASTLGLQSADGGATIRNPLMVVSYYDGKVEVHVINEDLGELAVDELSLLRALLRST